MNTNFAYDKMDYYSILEYLKNQATYFSDGEWTDFSDADIGTVILKLMAMNADTTNYQIEKGISELYLDTARERVNAIALCKLIGYEPRHYESAYAKLTCDFLGETSSHTIEPLTQFGSIGDYNFYSLDKVNLSPGEITIEVYEGTPVSNTITVDNIDEKGRYYLEDYNTGVNTVRVIQAGKNFTRVNNALYGEGESCFSVHIDLDNRLYIQFPTYYKTIISNGVTLSVNYLISNGGSVSIGAEAINGTMSFEDGSTLTYVNTEASTQGYNPETVEEIRKQAPAYASTMDTLVTLKDFRTLVNDFDGISDAVALDYNYEESGLVQPDETGVNDAYKVNLYILPTDTDNIYRPSSTDDYVQVIPEDITDMTSSREFIFEYDDVMNTYSSTNHRDNTSSLMRFKFKEDHSKVIFRIETSSEAGCDIFSIKINGNTVTTASGDYTGDYIIDDYSSGDIIEFVYEKDDAGSYGEDIARVSMLVNNDTQGEYSDKLTIVAENYIESIKKKKPAGILVNYYNVDYIRPHIALKVYMDKDDLRYSTTSSKITEFLVNRYSREIRKIGDALYNSHISKDILANFDYVKYIEYVNVENAVNGAIKANNKEFIEVLADNITVQVVPYEES